MHNDSYWHLIGKSGALKNKKITLIGPEIIIGRTDENDIVIPEHAVSRNHAKLEFKDNHLWLTDLKSKNGTYINQQKISTHRIKGQDFFQIGEAKATFKLISRNTSSTSNIIGLQKINAWLQQKNNRLLASALLLTLPILLQLLFFQPHAPEAKKTSPNAQAGEINTPSTEIPPTQAAQRVNNAFTPAQNTTNQTKVSSPENLTPSPSTDGALQAVKIDNLKQDLTSALSLEDYPAAHKILKQMTQIDPSKNNTDQLAFVEKTLKNKITQYEENALREYEKLNYDKAITEWQKALSLAKNLDEDLSRKIETQIKEAQEKFTGK
ncbi:FHA domain-containing protein [bacterium]|nr:FHA domain-containing protein [bacterium]